MTTDAELPPHVPLPPSESILRDRSFVVLLVVALVVALGFGLIVPVLPIFARQFGVGLFAVTGVIAVFGGVRLVANVPAGLLADRIGSRRAVGFGALVVAISSLLTAGAPSYLALLVLRGLGGFGSALFSAALLATIIRTAPPDQRGRATGLLQGAFLAGIAVGPAVGGLLAEPLGLRWPFVIYAFFCAAAGGVALIFLPPVKSPIKPTGHTVGALTEDGEVVMAAPASAAPTGIVATIRAGRAMCRDRAFVAALIMMVAARWASTAVRTSLVPVFGREVVGAGAGMVGIALTIAALTHILALVPAGKIADTYGRRILAWPAFTLFALVTLLIAGASTVPAFLVVLAAYGVGTGLTSVAPTAIVADTVSPEQAGLGVGVLNAAGDAGSVVGPLVSGALAQRAGYGWGFGVSAALLAVAAIAALRMSETLPSRRAVAS